MIRLAHIARLGTVPALALALFASPGASDADAARLKGDVAVSGPVVTLGDLFDGAGEAADVVVQNSPAPGLTDAISLSRLSSIARRNGMDWRNRSGDTKISVQRTGIPVDREELRAVLAESLAPRFSSLTGDAVLEIEFAPGSARVLVAEDEMPSVSVDRFSVDAASGRFVAMVRAPAHDANAPLRRLIGRAYAALDVPVLSGQKTSGDVIRASDLDWKRMPVIRLGQNMITDAGRLVGKTPRNSLRPGRPVRMSDIEEPVLVPKNALVTVSFKTGKMTLTTRGTAMQSGAMGEVIGVLNGRSRRIVQATVTGPGHAEVDNTASLQLVSAE
ncbi:flagellar basal body P-ring formation chaperone FlgA [Tepidicaulis sp. LMO-SS28]|uniref:flagellar basal body P-ring formation chaperone FlgA n=1 Tax=Tepidicaulis sp. LMO-SS28 TaxID=3447455 RepID=UPI003EE38E9C